MRYLFSFIFVLVLSSSAGAQDLRLPSAIYLGAATSDWTSHEYCRHASRYCGESNPIYNWVGKRSPLVTPLGVTTDLLTIYAVNRWVAPKHPKLATASLIAGAFIRSIAVAQNIRLASRLGCNAPIPEVCR